MSISAMKQALDALIWTTGSGDFGEGGQAREGALKCLFPAIAALRQAIAEAEKQEQKTPLKVLGLTVFTENRLRNGRVYDVETLQAMTNRDILAIPDMGKKALKEVLEALDVYAIDISQERVDETAKRKHEPVAWEGWVLREVCFSEGEPISHREPQWVGLTDGEVMLVMDDVLEGGGWLDVARAIEAKLKEKNCG